MATSIIGTAEGNSNGSVDTNLLFPTVVADDVAIILALLQGGTNTDPPTVSGFTYMGRIDHSTNLSVAGFRKTLDGSEDGTNAVGHPTEVAPHTWQMFVARGWKTAGATWPAFTNTTPDTNKAHSTFGAVTAVPLPSLTGTQANLSVVRIVAARFDAQAITVTCTPDVGAEIEDTPRNASTSHVLESAHIDVASASIPTRTYTISSAASTGLAITLAFELPVAGSTGSTSRHSPRGVHRGIHRGVT